MKIKKLSAKRFGCLKDWESPDIYGDIVVIHGNNESGKTTLFNLVSTVFYGWDPLSDNPYIPWDESFAECSAAISFDAHDGSLIDDAIIIRKLRNKPDGVIYTKDKRHPLANRPISELSSLSRDIYSEVYLLSVDGLKFPDNNTWNTLQDELLGGQYRAILRPLKVVTKELDDEASGLWRPDKKGNSKDKRLKNLQGELKEKLKEAEENEKNLRELEKNIEETNIAIKKYYEEKLDITEKLNRHEKLYPVYKKLKKIESLYASAGDIECFSHIPEAPEEAVNELNIKKDTLTEEKEKLALQNEAMEAVKGRYTKKDEAVLAHREDMESLIKSYSQVENDLSALSDLDAEKDGVKKRLIDRGAELLNGGWREGLEDTICHMDQAELRAAIQAYRAADAKYREAEARVLSENLGRARQSVPKFYMLLSILLMAFGVFGAIFSAASLELNTVFAYIWGLVALFGLSLMIIYHASKNGKDTQNITDASQYLKNAEDYRDRAAKQVRNLLNGLPIASGRLEDIGESLLLDVNMLKDLVYKINDIMEKEHKIIKRLRDKYRMLTGILEACGIEPYGSHGEIASNMLNNILMLEKILKDAEVHFSGYMDASSKLEGNRERISRLDKEIEDIDSQIKSIAAGLEHISGRDILERSENLKQRRKYISMAKVLKDELEHDYADLDEIKAAIKKLDSEGIPWMLDDDEILSLRARCGQIDEELTKLNENLGYMKNEIKQLRLHENPVDIKGRIQYIHIERKSAAEKRDRLLLLKNIILEGDRRFREENQPDVLHKAGQYISLITGGRYNRIYADENGEGLLVNKSISEDILDVEKRRLSRGTKEQIYLSLKLGLMDHLDSGGERLPMFLDEALVNWDSIRLKNTIKLLKTISQNRQVFIFTCSDNICSLLNGDNIQYIELC